MDALRLRAFLGEIDLNARMMILTGLFKNNILEVVAQKGSLSASAARAKPTFIFRVRTFFLPEEWTPGINERGFYA